MDLYEFGPIKPLHTLGRLPPSLIRWLNTEEPQLPDVNQKHFVYQTTSDDSANETSSNPYTLIDFCDSDNSAAKLLGSWEEGYLSSNYISETSFWNVGTQSNSAALKGILEGLLQYLKDLNLCEVSLTHMAFQDASVNLFTSVLADESFCASCEITNCVADMRNLIYRCKEMSAARLLDQLFQLLSKNFGNSCRVIYAHILSRTSSPLFTYLDSILMMNSDEGRDKYNEFPLSPGTEYNVNLNNLPQFISKELIIDISNTAKTFTSLSQDEKPLPIMSKLVVAKRPGGMYEFTKGFSLGSNIQSKIDFTESYQALISAYASNADSIYKSYRTDKELEDLMLIAEKDVRATASRKMSAQKRLEFAERRKDRAKIVQAKKQELKASIGLYLLSREEYKKNIEEADLLRNEVEREIELKAAGKLAEDTEKRRVELYEKYRLASEALERKEKVLDWKYRRFELNGQRESLFELDSAYEQEVDEQLPFTVPVHRPTGDMLEVNGNSPVIGSYSDSRQTSESNLETNTSIHNLFDASNRKDMPDISSDESLEFYSQSEHTSVSQSPRKISGEKYSQLTIDACRMTCLKPVNPTLK
jgi:hypothetical protein